MPFLDWVNKNQAQETTREVPYHLLKQASVHGDVSGTNADNLLIQGDNLLALKALIPFYAGRVKCIFIDPPYNTQSAFEHYDDKLEHSQWLSMMYPRLVLLRELLAEDGSIWVTIDDNEAHYLKVLMDEIFGRKNFLCAIAWEKRYAPPPDTKDFGYVHDVILVYRKSAAFKRNLLPATDEQASRYKNPDQDPRGPWKPENYTCRFTAEERPNLFYPIRQPNTGEEVWPKKTRVWAMSRESHLRNEAEGRIWWGAKGTNSVPSLKNFFSGVAQGMMPMSIWKHGLAGHNQDGKKEALALHGDAPFSTPKPEKLIWVILHIATQAGDLILDSFLGSGTTAAVAHKMGRSYIGIEMGEHARTHCLPRMQKVIEGEQGGISAAVEWQGGGGFRFCTLGEPAFDEHGRISTDIKFATLAAYVWHLETGEPGQQVFDKPLLGVHNGAAYYLLYNDILGDRRPAGGNVLTHAVLQAINEIFPHDGPKVVYGEMSRIGASRLAAEGITFKQIPYDVRMR
ncbi:site-specific DNA-methyltransferase [Comamonas sp. Z1]|uniref:site-specific DNA-methyltransferase n=1 Tax=Comamonas sp. Z1 TaxID=2601246 RepID=UPI0011E88724|nr:site-specific DNA-methyltransferase [Comamonas sp. Z1]TYK75888.1 site-specific DNA-methyltransferase [Comamonas sp. Z1]